MAMDLRQSIEDVKKEAERITLKRIRDDQEAQAAQQADDDAQEATNKTKK
jgi:hypothetical protein